MSYDIFLILDYILDNSNSFKELKSLTQIDIEYLKNKNQNINKRELYNFVYHGFHHSQKVMLFAYLIGKNKKLSDDDMKILLDAAVYHDIGRTTESEDEVHGLYSANKISNLFKDEFYKNKENIELLRAISEGHSRNDKYKEFTFENYDLSEESYERYSRLYDILKDADALDRTRFPKSTEESIKEEFLRDDYSKTLVDFAFSINKIYRSIIDKTNYNNYANLFSLSKSKNGCLHGIGWDFSKLESILDNGILSNFAASEQEVEISRNFEGNNSNMWISVIDSADVDVNGAAYRMFVENNIVFYAFCGNYHKGIDRTSEALSTGLPIKKGLYDDESFVFDRIDKEDIYAFVLPKNSEAKSLGELNYLSCSHNFNVIRNNVEHYFDYITNTCNAEIDTKKVNYLIEKLKCEEIKFGKLSTFEQRKEKDIFFSTVDQDVLQINSEVAKWMSTSFKKYFNLDENEEPTVGMLINDILKRKNISYEVMNPEETIYKLDLSMTKKKNS